MTQVDDSLGCSGVGSQHHENAPQKRVPNSDTRLLAQRAIAICGLEKVLNIGVAVGSVVGELLRLGANAYGVDEAPVPEGGRSNSCIPGRCSMGSILNIPFGEESFHTVVVIDCLEHLSLNDVPKALAEIYRVAKCSVFLRVPASNKWRSISEAREWWECRCIEAGFRRHPAYFRINEYETLNRDGLRIDIVLEKIPLSLIVKYPTRAVVNGDDLQDELRAVGGRADAGVMRYSWAAGYVKPGDRVLDVACGLGYGCHVFRKVTNADNITGITHHETFLSYAEAQFSLGKGIEFHCGDPSSALLQLADASFDIVVAFDVLERVEFPELLIRECFRLLTPGGRLIVGVANAWSDEGGLALCSGHRHVYSWGRLRQDVESLFIAEDLVAQTESRVRVSGRRSLWEHSARLFRYVRSDDDVAVGCEWCLMTAMKSPLQGRFDYSERVFRSAAASGHESLKYVEYFENPWLMHAMVNSEYRLRDSRALERLADEVMAAYPIGTNDYAAALCVKAYRVYEETRLHAASMLVGRIDETNMAAGQDPMALRWKISLLYVKARLLESLGQQDAAKTAYIECATINSANFGVHLATKRTDAAYRAGRLAYALGDREEARAIWANGMAIGRDLLEVSLSDIAINLDSPNLFNHGDGVREYTVAWDGVALCGNGLRLTREPGEVDYFKLNANMQSEYSGVTSDLVQVRNELRDRSVLLESVSHDLVARTKELILIRETLRERTEALERISRDLLSRTEELVETRETLRERTERLEKLLGNSKIPRNRGII